MTTVRNVFTSDVGMPGWLRRRQIRDETLTPIVTGKTFALGRVWAGELVPKVDAFIGQVPPLGRGQFALGHVVGAEPAPLGLDLGRLWTGFIDLRDALYDAVSGSLRSAEGDVVDLSVVLAELESFRRSVGSRPDMNTMNVGVAGLERAADAVTAQVRATRSTNDGHAYLARSRAASAAAFAQIRTAATRQYAGDQRPTRDSTGDVRDAVDRANRATDPRDQIRAINDANRAFHTARTRDHLDDLLPRAGTRGALERHIDQAGGSATSIADINAANHRFWAGR